MLDALVTETGLMHDRTPINRMASLWDGQTVETEPVKRFVKEHERNGEIVEVITEWWKAGEPQAEDGAPDIDPETGEPTGLVMIQTIRYPA